MRVVRPGGRVVASDPDHDTFATGAARNGGAGRRPYALFLDRGLVDVAVAPIPVLLTDLRLAQDVLWIGPTLERAQAAGAISPAAAGAWLADLEAASRAGRFFAAGFGRRRCGHPGVMATPRSRARRRAGTGFRRVCAPPDWPECAETCFGPGAAPRASRASVATPAAGVRASTGSRRASASGRGALPRLSTP